MGNILLAMMILVTTVAAFAFLYHVVSRFGKLMEDNYRGIRESYATDRKFYITETKGKSKKTILKEVSAMLDSLPDHDDHEIIICEAGSHRIIEFLTEPDQTTEDDFMPVEIDRYL